MNKVFKKEVIIINNEKKIYGIKYLPNIDGKYPIVIFSHGYNGTNIDFENNAKILVENGIAAYCFDFCGGSVNSKSSMNTEEMSIFTEMEDLKKVIEGVKTWPEIDTNNIFLFGGSQGGLVTSLVAEKYKDDINGVILLFPALCIANDWTSKYKSANDIPKYIDFWGMRLGEKYIKSVYGFNIFDNLGSYDKNILFLHGDKDLIVAHKYTLDISKKYKNSKVIIFEGEGHGFSKEGNLKVSNITVDFVKFKIN